MDSHLLSAPALWWGPQRQQMNIGSNQTAHMTCTQFQTCFTATQIGQLLSLSFLIQLYKNDCG